MQNEMNFAIPLPSIKDLCSYLCALKNSNMKEIIRFNAIAATLWTIWLDRNNQIFKEKVSTYRNTWEYILTLIGTWATRSSLFKNYSQSTVALNLNVFSN
uniref:Uncharacterized protein n=1 Tax=Cucumis melo TaxID=3656 RepID=A0A9I9E5W7_CUCME